MKKRENHDTESLLSHRTSHDSDAEVCSDPETGQSSSSKRHGPFNPTPHVFNLANCIVGVSVLAMPFVFQQCGILLAVLMIGFCSVLTKWTCFFLNKSSFMAKKRSYEALAQSALGPAGRRFIELCLLFFLVSSIIAFLVVIGDIGPHVVADYLDLEAPTSKLRTLVMVIVTLFLIFPLSLIGDLEKFAVVSSVAIFFYAVFVVRMIAEAVPVIWDGRWSVAVIWWRPSGLLACLPIVCMAMSCQTQLFCVIECIKDVTSYDVDSVVSHAVNFCSAMYAAVGLFGYVAFFDKELHGDVLVELHSSWFTQMLKLAFMLSIAVSIPLMLFPARSALFNLVLRPSGCELSTAVIEKSTFHVLTFVIIISNLMVALVIPNVEFILGLTGSLIGSLVSTIIPSLLFICVAKKKAHHYIRVAKTCLVIGCFILLASTWATLQSEKRSTTVEKPIPKDSVVNEPALKSLERLEEKVLDANMNISAKLDDIASMAAKGDKKEASKLQFQLEELKEQQQEQAKLIKKQEQIVDELNKHIDKHKLAHEETEKGVNLTAEVVPEEEKKPPPSTTTTTPPPPAVRKEEVKA